MGEIQALMHGFAVVLSPMNVLLMFIGIILGVLIAALLGLGNGGRYLADMGGQLVTLKFGRDDESESDLIGMELAARAGYDPRSGITLWNKMAAANKGAPPEWLSTHPSSSSRIQDIEAALPLVMPLYERAAKPDRVWGPPPPAAAAAASAGVR